MAGTSPAMTAGAQGTAQDADQQLTQEVRDN